jgi:hypothetical protein
VGVQVPPPTLQTPWSDGVFALPTLESDDLWATRGPRLGHIAFRSGISGEDALTVDRKWKPAWSGRLPTRFIILTNEIPELWDASGALASRFILLVLTKSFRGKENIELTDQLLEQAPGILNWSLVGLDRLTERGHFKMPESSKAAVLQLEDLASPISAFLRERCELDDPNKTVLVETLWGAWKLWCEDNNRSIGTKAVFGRNLAAACPTVRKVRPWKEEGPRPFEYQGLALQDPVPITTRSHRDCRDWTGLSHSSHRDYPLYWPRQEEEGHLGHRKRVGPSDFGIADFLRTAYRRHLSPGK